MSKKKTATIEPAVRPEVMQVADAMIEQYADDLAYLATAEPEPLQVDEPPVERAHNPNTLVHLKKRLEEAEALLWRFNLYYLREVPPCQFLGEWQRERESVAHEVRAMFGEVQG